MRSPIELILRSTRVSDWRLARELSTTMVDIPETTGRNRKLADKRKGKIRRTPEMDSRIEAVRKAKAHETLQEFPELKARNFNPPTCGMCVSIACIPMTAQRGESVSTPSMLALRRPIPPSI